MPSRICSIEGCGEKHWARGYCDRHYAQARKNGLPTLTLPSHHVLSEIDLGEMTAQCRACARRVTIRKLNSVKHPVCEPNLIAKRRAKRKRDLARDRASYNAYHRTYGRLRKYGLTGDLAGVLAQYGGACGICEQPLTVETMRIDHDHSCCDIQPGGKACGQCVRGILCQKCNSGLGLLGDDAEGLRRAIRYLASS